MARTQLYKLVNAASKDLGSGGGQILIGEIGKIDAQGIKGFFKNLNLSVIVNDYPSDELPGFIAYLTTSATYSDDQIITARAFLAGGSVRLNAYRRIEADTAQAFADFGKVYLWLEATDTTVTDDMPVRYVAETWGRWIDFTEV